MRDASIWRAGLRFRSEAAKPCLVFFSSPLTAAFTAPRTWRSCVTASTKPRRRARQAHRAAKAGMQPKQHFGKAEARVIDGDAIVAGKCEFEPAAEAIAVDDGDGYGAEPIEPVEHRMAACDQRLDFGYVLDAAKLRDIGAGDEAAALGRADHDAARRIGFERLQDGVELGKYLR